MTPEAARAPSPWQQGWLAGARRIDSPNHDARPAGEDVSLVVLHSISLPPGRYGTPAVEQLFTNTLDPAAHPAFAGLEQLRVAAHFVIRRGGALEQYVSADNRAWHAGVSCFEGRERCNDFSVGIELEGLEGLRFTAAQYRRLARLLRALSHAYPSLRAVAGHEHIAPGRKRDPGPGFDWARACAEAGLPQWRWPAQLD